MAALSRAAHAPRSRHERDDAARNSSAGSGPFRSTRPSLPARVERLYIAFVSCTLGVAGTAIGFTLGVIPYFRAQLNPTHYDGFFAASVLIGMAAGFVAGVACGPRWYRRDEATPLSQRRMMAYLKRRQSENTIVPERTMNSSLLRTLIGSKHPRRG